MQEDELFLLRRPQYCSLSQLLGLGYVWLLTQTTTYCGLSHLYFCTSIWEHPERPDQVDLVILLGVLKCKRSHGTRPFKILKTSNTILKTILNFTGSSWKEARTNVM